MVVSGNILFYIKYEPQTEKTLLIPSREKNDESGHCATSPAWNRTIAFLVIALLISGALIPLYPFPMANKNITKHVYTSQDTAKRASRIPWCGETPCFRPAQVQVVRNQPGFPSFWNYAGPMNVSYDGRSIIIDGDRALFLSGSMHPVRATKGTWELALNEAVRNGLNMITLYLMWSAHQPFANSTLDWHISEHWELADAIKSAANHGLFVHIRLGPYVCAEYSYGGIPEWLPLKYPDIVMRRPSRDWLDVMSDYISNAVEYLSINKLWAYQGGPIVMAQIENELGGDIDPSDQPLLLKVTQKGEFVDPKDTRDQSSLRNATLQDYADWTGRLAIKIAPKVIWTMCNGLTANGTINTFNGDFLFDNWMNNYGDNGRVQVDQPALWTEDEGGFQIWGDEPKNPSDYFWGHTSRSMTFAALQWFARGGTHLNYYMWWGGYNRARMAAAGIMNAYACDAVLCPNGQRHEPKFGHFTSLHQTIAEAASVLLELPSALHQKNELLVMDTTGHWVIASKQQMFIYAATQEIIFVENYSDSPAVVKIRTVTDKDEFVLDMPAFSAVLFVDGILSFDSAAIRPNAMSFRRKLLYDPASLLDEFSWAEAHPFSDGTYVTSQAPIEQTQLCASSFLSTDYAWYETTFELQVHLRSAYLYVDTHISNGIVVFIDGSYVGSNDTHYHAEGNALLQILLTDLSAGHHKLTILSESLGYHNLVGRWGGSTRAKRKGITGNVLICSTQLAFNLSLVDGREWKNKPGLSRENHMKRRPADDSSPGKPMWTSLSFDLPLYDPSFQGLFVKIATGRGHLWLNGYDLGRYWNITRGDTTTYSQNFYFLPYDLLLKDGTLNELIFFDSLGKEQDAHLVLSWLEVVDHPILMDDVDFPLACI